MTPGVGRRVVSRGRAHGSPVAAARSEWGSLRPPIPQGGWREGIRALAACSPHSERARRRRLAMKRGRETRPAARPPASPDSTRVISVCGASRGGALFASSWPASREAWRCGAGGRRGFGAPRAPSHPRAWPTPPRRRRRAGTSTSSSARAPAAGRWRRDWPSKGHAVLLLEAGGEEEPWNYRVPALPRSGHRGRGDAPRPLRPSLRGRGAPGAGPEVSDGARGRSARRLLSARPDARRLHGPLRDDHHPAARQRLASGPRRHR